MSPQAPKARGTARISLILLNAICVWRLNSGDELVMISRLLVTCAAAVCAVTHCRHAVGGQLQKKKITDTLQAVSCR